MNSEETTIDNLADEMLLLIMRHCRLKDVINFRTVCKRWLLICKDSCLLRSVPISSDIDCDEIKIILKMMNTFPVNLKILNRHDLKHIL